MAEKTYFSKEKMAELLANGAFNINRGSFGAAKK